MVYQCSGSYLPKFSLVVPALKTSTKLLHIKLHWYRTLMIMGRTVLASNESLSPTHPFTLNMVRNEYQAEAAEGKQLHFRRCTGHALRSTDCSILTYTTDLSFYLTQGSTLLYVAFSSKTDLLDEMQGCRLRSPLPPVITRFCNWPLRCFVNFP